MSGSHPRAVPVSQPAGNPLRAVDAAALQHCFSRLGGDESRALRRLRGAAGWAIAARMAGSRSVRDGVGGRAGAALRADVRGDRAGTGSCGAAGGAAGRAGAGGQGASTGGGGAAGAGGLHQAPRAAGGGALCATGALAGRLRNARDRRGARDGDGGLGRWRGGASSGAAGDPGEWHAGGEAAVE